MMTGRYQQRFGYVHFTGGYQEQIDGDRGVPTSEIFMSDQLRMAGYRTGIVGFSMRRTTRSFGGRSLRRV